MHALLRSRQPSSALTRQAQTVPVRSDSAADGHRDGAEGAGRRADAAGERHGGLAARRSTNAGITIVRDAAIYAPNTHFTDFTARKLSNARFRGIGSSPANPGITTYFDGVPQLNSNTSSIDLLDVEQIEFVRGPQSALFGRNTLGGVINVVERAAVARRTGRGAFVVPLANFDARDLRAQRVRAAGGRPASAPASPFRYGQRDGFTRNVVTGNDVDYREAFPGKGQVLWTPSSIWETRVIVSGERARDGDYALSDLGGAARPNPFEIARRLRGPHRSRHRWPRRCWRAGPASACNLSTHDRASCAGRRRTPRISTTRRCRSCAATTPKRAFSSRRKCASPRRRMRRCGSRTRAAQVAGGRVRCSRRTTSRTRSTRSRRSCSRRSLPFAVSQHSPQSTLDDFGIGVYGQGTVTLGGPRRSDRRRARRPREARTRVAQHVLRRRPIAPGRQRDAGGELLERVAAVLGGRAVQPDRMVYGVVGARLQGGRLQRGVAGRQRGLRRRADLEPRGRREDDVGGRPRDGQRRGVPHRLGRPAAEPAGSAVPAQFYIANVGGAVEHGRRARAERARACRASMCSAPFGYTERAFDEGSVSSGVNVGGNEIPNTPDYTATFGAQVSRALRSDATAVRPRGGRRSYGAFHYDEPEHGGAGALLAGELRAGVRIRHRVRRGLDEERVRHALHSGGVCVRPRLAPSGFIGEMGAPRTFGVKRGRHVLNMDAGVGI